MKTINKEIVTKKTITVYEAADGRQFMSEEECKKYEGTYRCAIDAAFKPLVKKNFDGELFQDAISCPSCEDKFYIVHVDSIDDIKAVNMKIEASKSGGLTVPVSCVGKDIVISTYDYDDGTYYCGTVNEYVEKLTKNIKNLCTVKEEKGEN